MTPGEQTRDYYRKQGRKAEQDRIVSLLEDSDKHLIVWDTSIKKNQNRLIHGPKCGVCMAINLIKGQA